MAFSRIKQPVEERGVRLGHGVWDLLFRRVDIVPVNVEAVLDGAAFTGEQRREEK